jgi:hypothetical protein
MKQHRLVRVLIMVWITILPIAGRAAVSDWYGTWQSSYTGDSSGTCAVIIGTGNASQASVSMSCSSSTGDPPTSSAGFITASGAISLSGSATGSSGGYSVQIGFSGMIQGNVGQGQWTSMTVTPMGLVTMGGSWTTNRISPPQPVATDPNQLVAPAPTAQTAYTVSAGRLPEAAVNTSATGTLGRASLSVALDLSKIPLEGSFAAQGQFAAGYNVYVAALVPAGVLSLPNVTWFMLRPTPDGWAMLASPIAAYLQGVAQDAGSPIVQVLILENLDVTALLGSEIYVGYGLDSDEMLAQGRYRGVYIVR